MTLRLCAISYIVCESSIIYRLNKQTDERMNGRKDGQDGLLYTPTLFRRVLFAYFVHVVEMSTVDLIILLLLVLL